MKNKTNADIVKDFMEFSRTGGITQIFVIQALTHYAQRVIQDQDQLRETMQDAMINPEAWIAAAKEWLQVEEENYGKR